MKQNEWFSIDDVAMVEDTNTIVDVLFSNGNIIDGTFYTYIEWFAIQGRYHVKHHMFKNKITEKSVELTYSPSCKRRGFLPSTAQHRLLGD